MNAEWLLNCFNLLGDKPETVQQLRKLIVALAVAGKLTIAGDTARDAETLLKQIEKRQSELIAKGQLRKLNPRTKITVDELPNVFSIPEKFVRLGSIARIEKGLTGIMKSKPGPFPLVVTAEARANCDHYDFDGAAAIVPLVSSAGHGKASLQRLHYQEGKFALGSILAAVFPRAPDLISARFLFEFLSAFKEELLVSQMIGTANVALSVRRISDVPVPLVSPSVQGMVDELMALCDQLATVRADREATRDRLAAASLTRLSAPVREAASFADHTGFALNNLAAITARHEQVKQLRQTVLNLAVRGKLVPQDPSDESASELLKRIAAAKAARGRTTNDARIKLEPDPSPDRLPLALPPQWSVQSFENLFLFIDYRGRTPPKTENGTPLITAKNIRMGYLSREPREYISETTYRTWMVRGFPEVGDLLFTTEAPLANVCLNDIGEPFALAQRAICFQPYAKVDTRFLMFALMSDLMQCLIESHATGMTAKGIKAANLKPLPMPIPPLVEQHRIVAKIDALMALCDRLETSLITRDTCRNKLLDALIADALAPGGSDLAAA